MFLGNAYLGLSDLPKQHTEETRGSEDYDQLNQLRKQNLLNLGTGRIHG
jgi:hypothetical protein